MTDVVDEGEIVLPPPSRSLPPGVMLVDRVWVTETRVG